VVEAITQRGVTFYISGSRQEEYRAYLAILGGNSTWNAQVDFIRDTGRNQIVISDNLNDLPASIRSSAYRNVYQGFGGEVGAATLDPQGSNSAFILFNGVDGYISSGGTSTYRSGFSTFVHEVYHIGYQGTAAHPDWWLRDVNKQLEEFGIIGEAQMRGRLTFDRSDVPRPTLDLTAPQSSDMPVRRDDPSSENTRVALTEEGWVLFRETVDSTGRPTDGLEVHTDTSSTLSRYGYTADGIQYLAEQSETLPTRTDSGWTTTVVDTRYTVDANGVPLDWDTTVSVTPQPWVDASIFNGNAIGGIFGSAIGQAIGGGNVFARVGAQTALTTVLGTVGTGLDLYFRYGAASGNLTASVGENDNVARNSERSKRSAA
jgi:hypothetical protein